MTKTETAASLIIFIILVGLGAAAYFFFANPAPQTPPATSQACTEEAKICPDGSAVGRTGPNCNFAECPQVPVINGWKTVIDSAKRAQFQYPENVGATYISLVDWPPQIQVLNQAFTCTEGGTEIATAGATSKVTINNKEYCVTKESEGAAGSIYTLYAYAAQKGAQTVILTFSLRFNQCGNYPEPKKTACETERQSFNINPTIDQIMSTVQFTQ